MESIEGEAGNFTVNVLKRPRYIDEDVCTACGSCVDYCPVEMRDPYNEGLSNLKSLYIPYPQAVPAAYVIDPATCLFVLKKECRQCEQACKELKAIDLNQQEEHLQLRVGSVIITPGFDEFDATRNKDYGYGEYPNVITSIEFERMLSASGPFQGRITRPSDGAAPKRIAFLQCVGSRDRSANAYCSSVCCTYSIKEAIIAKEHDPGLEITIFYMDIRTQGKGFESFYERAKNQVGIRFERTRLPKIEHVMETENLCLRFVTEDGRHENEEFDLVVLSVGLEPAKKARELATRLDLELNEEGFCRTAEFSPMATEREGIFVAGAFQSPKDIPESVTQASGSVSQVSGLLADARGTMVEEKQLVPETDISGEEPRIGVFVCHCGVNVAGVADVSLLKEYAGTLDEVVFAEESLYACSRDSQEKIKEMIKEHRLNRVVMAACTPADSRTRLSGYHTGSGSQSMPFRNGQHKGPMYLGSCAGARTGNRKGEGSHKNGSSQGQTALPLEGRDPAGDPSRTRDRRWAVGDDSCTRLGGSGVYMLPGREGRRVGRKSSGSLLHAAEE